MATLNYAMGFISKKTYYNFETTLSLPGMSLFYCIATGIGLISAFSMMPETESRSLEDIELHITDNSKKLTDWRIQKVKPLARHRAADDVENPDKTFTTRQNANNEEMTIRNHNQIVATNFDNKGFELESP